MKNKREEILNFTRDIDRNQIDKIGIYFIFNKRTKKFYIGSTLTNDGFIKRFTEHINSLNANKHHSPLLQNSWNKTDIKENTWEFQIIEICDKENGIIREQYYLDTLLFAQEYLISKGKDRRFLNLGYNISPIAKRPCYIRNRRKVYQYNLEGEFIDEWNSTLEVSLFYQVAETNLVQAIKGGGRRSCKRYRWSYNKVEILEIPNYKITGSNNRRPQNRDLYLFSNTGEFLHHFDSYFSAETFFQKQYNIKLGRNKISRCLSGKRNSYKNIIWKNQNSINLKNVKDNAILFKDDIFIGVFLNLHIICVQFFGKTEVGWLNDYVIYKNYKIFKRKSLEISKDINTYLND